MKFYIPNNFIHCINEKDCRWLMPADFNQNREALVFNEWSSGWIFEADDSFNTYFTIVTGNQLPTITDAEYAQFVIDKVAFLGRERAKQFRTAWIKFRPR